MLRLPSMKVWSIILTFWCNKISNFKKRIGWMITSVNSWYSMLLIILFSLRIYRRWKCVNNFWYYVIIPQVVYLFFHRMWSRPIITCLIENEPYSKSWIINYFSTFYFSLVLPNKPFDYFTNMLKVHSMFICDNCSYFLQQ